MYRLSKARSGFSRHRKALLLKQQFMALVGYVRCSEILTGPARAVTIDYGRVAYGYGCSQACKAHGPTVPTRALYCRVDVRVPTIPKNIDNPKTIHIEEGWFHTQTSAVIGPYDFPSSGPGPLIVIMRRCGHIHTGVLWVICMFFGHGVARNACSLRFTCGHPRGPIVFQTGMGTSVHAVLW